MPYKDPQRIKEYQTAYRETHREESRVYHAKRRKGNREWRIAYLREWRLQNPEKSRNGCLAWRKANPEAARISHQNSYRKRTYGLSNSDVDKMKEEQRGLCAICSEPLGTRHKMHIDHCHTTGRVRGLLCSRCNRGLSFIELEAWLPAALEYLKK
jgi:hypothetical protein